MKLRREGQRKDRREERSLLLRGRCPLCERQTKKIIYAGLPGRFCECSMMTGAASWAAWLYFSGRMFVYEGGYWRALWEWFKGE